MCGCVCNMCAFKVFKIVLTLLTESKLIYKCRNAALEAGLYSCNAQQLLASAFRCLFLFLKLEKTKCAQLIQFKY